MTTTRTLTAEQLTLGYGDRAVIHDLDLTVPAGRITAIVGANACGKPTLLRSMTRLLVPRGGQVLLDGKAVHRMPAKEVLDLLTDLNRLRGTTIVMVLHDLNLAARYADHLVALAGGRLHAVGEPSSVLTQDNVRTVFGLDCRVIVDPVSGRPLVLPIGRHHVRAPAALSAGGVAGV